MTALTPDDTILGLLAVQPCHGYELVEVFNDPAELGAVWKMSTSQIYAVLKRLERRGLIIGHTVQSQKAPNRTEYHLTPAGRQRLDAWLHDPQPSASIRRIRVEFLSRLYVARQLNLPTAAIILRQRAACEAKRDQLRSKQQQRVIETEIGYLAHELVLAQLEAVLRWIEQYVLTQDLVDNKEH